MKATRKYRIYHGHDFAYMVMPMIPHTPSTYRPRPLWFSPKTNPPHYWTVYKSDLEEGGPRSQRFTYDSFDFPTQKAANAAAQQMAATDIQQSLENKTRRLLKSLPTD